MTEGGRAERAPYAFERVYAPDPERCLAAVLAVLRAPRSRTSATGDLETKTNNAAPSAAGRGRTARAKKSAV